MANIDNFPSLFTPNEQGDFPWDHPSWTDAGMSKIQRYQAYAEIRLRVLKTCKRIIRSTKVSDLIKFRLFSKSKTTNCELVVTVQFSTKICIIHILYTYVSQNIINNVLRLCLMAKNGVDIAAHYDLTEIYFSGGVHIYSAVDFEFNKINLCIE